MTEINQIEQTTMIKYKLPFAINLGDVFYSIEKIGTRYYYEPCQVCGDTKKLTINNITFDCPCCDKNRVSIAIGRYKVCRWRVYSITQFVSDNGYWKMGTNKNEEFLLYTTYERGYGNIKHMKLNTRDFKNYYNLNFEQILKINNSQYEHIEQCIYDNYSLVCQLANKLNEYEEQKVAEHNNKFGTNYELPPKPKYDPKSK